MNGRQHSDRPVFTVWVRHRSKIRGEKISIFSLSRSHGLRKNMIAASRKSLRRKKTWASTWRRPDSRMTFSILSSRIIPMADSTRNWRTLCLDGSVLDITARGPVIPFKQAGYYQISTGQDKIFNSAPPDVRSAPHWKYPSACITPESSSSPGSDASRQSSGNADWRWIQRTAHKLLVSASCNADPKS